MDGIARQGRYRRVREYGVSMSELVKPPEAEELGLVSASLRDLPRFALWASRDVFLFTRPGGLSGIAMLTLSLYLVLPGGTLGSTRTSPSPLVFWAESGMRVTLAFLLACLALILVSSAVWLCFFARPDVRVYTTFARTAVLVVTARRHKRQPSWKLGEHTVSVVGRGYGRELRGAMAESLRERADETGVLLWGRAVNRFVQDLYLDQFPFLEVDGRTVSYQGRGSRETIVRSS